MSTRFNISIPQTFRLLESLKNRILAAYPVRPVQVYGIPRGGTIVAMLLNQRYDLDIEVVDDPQLADVLVDDFIDTGATANRWLDETGKPVYPLMDKSSPGYPDVLINELGVVQNRHDWPVLPWEQGDEASGGIEIATRLLQYLGEDPKRQGLVNTPERFCKAWQFWTSGYGVDLKPLITTFEDGAENVDEMILLRDIPVWSMCEHHLAPFFGVAHVGYVPKGRVLGLSKISRVVDVFARRLQVQERLTTQVADTIQQCLDPHGVGVMLECRHTCMESRGIRQAGITTTTTALRGVMRTDSDARTEFLMGVR